MVLAPERVVEQRQVRGVPAPRPQPVSPHSSTPPALAEGVELCGEYEGSGFKEPHYLVRRADGQTIQLTRLLYLVAEQANGRRDHAEIAQLVSKEYGRTVSADNVRVLAEDKLAALGVVTGPDGSQPDVTPLDPLLAFKFKTKVVPRGVVRAITAIFYPLFFPPVVVAALGAFVALDVWLFFVHGVGQSMRETLYQPATFLLVFSLIVVSAAFHECGHATACRYGGAEPGAMGAGVYVAWPAFYTDVTDAYRLGKWARLRTDLGGVYFNIVFALAVAGVYFATGYEPLLLLVVVQQVEIVHQLLPFLRLDGYYIISDLTGVPDLFLRLGPILRSAVPGREADPKVTELKPWVRVAVTGWVVVVIPVLAANLLLILLNVPKILATSADSLDRLRGMTGDAIDSGNLAGAGVSIVQILLLALPMLALVLTFVRLGMRATRSGWSWSRGRPVRRLAFVTLLTAAVAGLAYAWWPSADYRPIEEGERGTLTESVALVTVLPEDRPAEPASVSGDGADQRDDGDDEAVDGSGDGAVDGGAVSADPTTAPTPGTSTSTDASQPLSSSSPEGPAEPSPSSAPEASGEPTPSPEVTSS